MCVYLRSGNSSSNNNSSGSGSSGNNNIKGEAHLQMPHLQLEPRRFRTQIVGPRPRCCRQNLLPLHQLQVVLINRPPSTTNTNTTAATAATTTTTTAGGGAAWQWHHAAKAAW